MGRGLRIVAGRFGGRRLQVPAGRDTRPTSERVREALFAILGASVEGARVADLFAGTGALGLEALSRGAAWADFYERHPPALAALVANVRALGVTAQSAVIGGPLPRSLGAGEPYDLVLADPPWGRGLALPVLERLVAVGRLAPGALLVLEEERGRHPDPSVWPALGMELVDERRYGDTAVQLVAWVENPP